LLCQHNKDQKQERITHQVQMDWTFQGSLPTKLVLGIESTTEGVQKAW